MVHDMQESLLLDSKLTLGVAVSSNLVDVGVAGLTLTHSAT